MLGKVRESEYHMRLHILSTRVRVLSLLSVFLVNGGLLANICSTHNLNTVIICLTYSSEQ